MSQSVRRVSQRLDTLEKSDKTDKKDSSKYKISNTKKIIKFLFSYLIKYIFSKIRTC
jgi:hypothetical protein